MSTKDQWVLVNNSTEEKEEKGMKVLVTGASGLLGRQIMSTLRAESVPCLGLCYSRQSDGLIRQDRYVQALPLLVQLPHYCALIGRGL